MTTVTRTADIPASATLPRTLEDWLALGETPASLQEWSEGLLAAHTAATITLLLPVT